MRRSWWERSIDHHFRIIEGGSSAKRDPDELKKEIADRVKEIREETRKYRARFQEDLDKYAERLNSARSGVGGLEK